MRAKGTVEKPATNGDTPVLPSFFIIGPPRTGTSWLHQVLSKRASLSHPTKETRFFDRHFYRGLDWYGSHYRKAVPGRPVGEIAPIYFASPETRERIAALIPQARIVCTFRNPVDRVVSLYRLKRAYGFIPWNLEEALERDPELMESSRYSAHLKGWRKTFGNSQVMVTMHEDMQADPQGYLDRLVDFVGVPRVTLVASHRRRVLTSEDMTEPRNYYLTRGAISCCRSGRGHCVWTPSSPPQRSWERSNFLSEAERPSRKCRQCSARSCANCFGRMWMSWKAC